MLKVRKEEGSFVDVLWRLAGGRPAGNDGRAPGDLPAETAASREMSRQLRARGFRFVGPTTCYAFMQAVGMVNDHAAGCFRRGEVGRGL